MTDKEFRKLRRDDLIEIIYQLQRNELALKEENAELKKQLDERRIQIEEAGSIAEASLRINEVFEAAQRAADQYLAEIKRAKVESQG